VDSKETLLIALERGQFASSHWTASPRRKFEIRNPQSEISEVGGRHS